MLAGKGIIKREISQALRDQGRASSLSPLLHAGSDAYPGRARQTSQDAMIFPSSGISFPSPAARFNIRWSQDIHCPTDRKNAKPLFCSPLRVMAPAYDKLFQRLLINGTHPAL